MWLCNLTVKIGDKHFKQELCHLKHHCIAKNIGNDDGNIVVVGKRRKIDRIVRPILVRPILVCLILVCPILVL